LEKQFIEGSKDVGVRGQVFYFSSLVTQVTSGLIRVNIYLAHLSIYLSSTKGGIGPGDGSKSKVVIVVIL
jgi:hypothetical protein